MATEDSCPFRARAHELLHRFPLGQGLTHSDLGGFLMDFDHHLTDLKQLKVRLDDLYLHME